MWKFFRNFGSRRDLAPPDGGEALESPHADAEDPPVNLTSLPLSADAPITEPGQDRLNRAPFARRIAEAILAWNDESSIVIGIYGQWGSGKSSVLNLVTAKLEESVASRPSDKDPLIIHFNAWGYSQQAQMITAFFNTLSSRLDVPDETASGRKIAKRLQAYSSLLAPVQFVASVIHPSLRQLAKEPEPWQSAARRRSKGWPISSKRTPRL